MTAIRGRARPRPRYDDCSALREAGVPPDVEDLSMLNMPVAGDAAAPSFPEDVAARCRGEFLEMPGMRLTVRQAARLWSATPDVCETVLEALAGSGFLRRTGHTYMRADSGRSQV
jgi:hypothetical protein